MTQAGMERWLKIVILVVFVLAIVAFCSGCEVGYEWHAVVKAAGPAEVQAGLTEPEPLDEGDDRLFRRLRSHIDRRIEEKVLAGVQEASGEKKSGFGSVLAGALAKLVKIVLLSVIEAILVAVLVTLLWKYLVWILAILLAWLGFSALAGYLGGRHAVKKGAAGGPAQAVPGSPAGTLGSPNSVHGPQQPGAVGGPAVDGVVLPPTA